MAEKLLYFVFLTGYMFMPPYGKTEAQSLPAGTAGIVYTYDAAGDRVKSEYVFNNTQSGRTKNGGADSAMLNEGLSSLRDSSDAAKGLTEQVVKVNALYPNPTTGIITVRLTKPIKNGKAQIVDGTGRVLLNSNVTGIILSFDLSEFESGIYFLDIEQGNEKYSMKIIKQ